MFLNKDFLFNISLHLSILSQFQILLLKKLISQLLFNKQTAKWQIFQKKHKL